MNDLHALFRAAFVLLVGVVATIDLHDLHRAATAALRPFRGALRLLRPGRLDRDGARNFDALVELNKLITRFPRNDQERMRREERTSLETNRRTAGAIARHRAREVRGLVARGRDAIATIRRDVRASMPAALDHLTADGMVSLALLRVQLMPLLRAAGPLELFAVYQSAVQRQDARGYVEAEIIEGLIAAGATALPQDGVEKATAKQLREYVQDVQDLRLPTDVPNFDELEAEVSHLDAMADAINLQGIDPEQMPAAGEVFAQLAADLDAAAEASGGDDIAAARKEAAAV